MDTLQYRAKQLKQLQALHGYKIKIIDDNGNSTHWLNIKPHELDQIKIILEDWRLKNE